MPGSNPIYYKDLVSPDDSIERLIKELNQLKSTYSDILDLVKKGATEIQESLKTASGANESSRETIKKAASDASRLEKAERELAFAMSETGVRVQELKVLTQQVNKENRDAVKFVQSASDSYNRMDAELRLVTQQLRDLNQQEALNSKEGAKLINRILELKDSMQQYDNAVKLRIQSQIRYNKEVQSANSSEEARKSILSQLAQAEEKLAFARSKENEQLKLYSTQIREANEIAKLNVTIANSAEGSYNRLSAQYSLNKIKLNQMSAEERSATEAGKALEQQTYEIYQQMIKLQEATGKHNLSVGNYKKSWDGLGMSVGQIVRELPAAAVSLNTFFLGISNNVPILVDEIQRLRAQNKQFIAEGKQTVSVTGSIVKSLFSWNTALVVILTVFSMYGKEIIDWVRNLLKAEKGVESLNTKLTTLHEEFTKNGVSSLAKNIVKLKSLQQEWNRLTTKKEQLQWINDNKTAFDQLDISINNVSDAENVFVNNTQAVIEAFKQRAKAAAANRIAEKKFEEVLIKREEAALKRKKAEQIEKAGGSTAAYSSSVTGAVSYQSGTTELFFRKQADAADELADKLEKNIDFYFETAEAANKAADEILKAAGVDSAHKKQKKQKEPRRKRDATDILNRNELNANKKYQESLSRLEQDEFAKRRKEAIETYNSNTAALNNMYDKNKRILENQDKLYKDLSDDQKKQVEETQITIVNTIQKYQEELNQELEFIEKDRQINELKLLQETIDLRLKAVKEGSEEEINLKLAAIQAEQQIALLQNAKLPKAQRKSEADIKAGFSKQGVSTIAEYDISAFDQQQALEEARFNVVKHTENQITKFKLEQEKERWLEQIAQAEAGSLDWSQTQIETAKETVKGINRELSEIDDVLLNIGKNGLGYTLLESFGFNDDQIDAFTEATDIVISQLQSIMQAEVDLAQAALESANSRAEAAQTALDAEVEARNLGYASSVISARKELEQAKKQQREKQRLLEEAQRNQQQIDTLTQTSSLITASANIWSSLSKIPIVGPALAIAAIGTMWTSFAVAKVKAKQVTASQSEEYGEGGYEVLEGGSHASGNDIDLGITNKRKKRMKAEGGEAIAIINKRSTRKYSKIIPDVIESLNKGVFEDKYANAFSDSDKIIMMQKESTNIIDLSTTENELRAIRKQGEIKYFQGPDGSIIEIKGNVKRVIKE